MKNAVKTLGIIALAASLGACASNTPTAPENYDAKLRASAEIIRLPQSFPVAALENADTFDENFDRFLIEAEARYGDRFWLDSGDGVSLHHRELIKRAVLVRGLTFSGEAPLGPKPANGSVTLYLERYVASVPQCGDWPEADLGSENNTSSYWGCSNTANLALMVADPRDLVSGVKGRASTDIAVTAITKSRAAARNNNGQAGRLTAGAGTTSGGNGNN